ncbi:RNA methyltransferase [Hydrogenophaga sp.]|uniref:TrmH family RNA methyltransferase n=1 Tax=Hydrogenophaga sp. TaxID=1904254 RepID=UPI0019A5FBD2|nr:RNA methyltransferase [Hydrogenophaga sp.]MBD3892757.1 RNA methyltransferase [Hydrogenophaga sp.]
MKPPTLISSRENPVFKRLRLLAQDNTAYRDAGQVWIEGDHLCRALLAHGQRPALAVFSQSYWPQAPVELRQAAQQNLLLSDALLTAISGLESAAALGFVCKLPQADRLLPGRPAVLLDRLQDAGNVGSILRSAAAMGFEQVLALKGTAALWSPKVLRAGMGAHFALHLVEGLALTDLGRLALPLLVTCVHQGEWLHQAQLPWPCAWVFGHEGQGASPALAALAAQSLRIAQPGGQESLNVAAAAAICLYASASARDLR